jgi:diguanylate cyclase (GGDEF)-like protein
MSTVHAAQSRAERGVMKLGIWTRLVPPLLLVGGGIAALTVSIPAAGSERREQREFNADRDTVESIRLLANSEQAVNQLLIARWKTALGRDADLESLRGDLARSLDVLRTGPKELADAFNDGFPEMVDPQLTATAREEMGAVGEIGVQLSDALTRLTSAIDRPELGSGVAFVRKVNELDQFVTSMRIVRGLDPEATDADAQSYLVGSVSAINPVPDPSTRLDELLSERNAPPEFSQDAFAGIVTDPDVAQWMAEARWAVAGGTETGDRASTTDIDRLSAVVTTRVGKVVDDEITAEADRFETLADDAGRTALIWMLVGVGAVFSMIVGLVLGALGLRKALLKLRLASELDELTGLVNRVGLRSRTEPWLVLGRSGPVGVSVLDLDDFKLINDNYGHEAGDRVLDILAKRVSSNVVHSSTSVGRWGGDEFVIVFKLSDGDGPPEIARMNARLLRAVREPIDLGPAVVALSASIGSSVCACGGCNFDDLFREADRRLYDVKRASGNGTAVGECRASATVSEPVATATSFGDTTHSS